MDNFRREERAPAESSNGEVARNSSDSEGERQLFIAEEFDYNEDDIHTDEDEGETEDEDDLEINEDDFAMQDWEAMYGSYVYTSLCRKLSLLPQLSIARIDPIGQVFSLRWNNHQNNLLSVFECLLQTEAFCDVTLACDGGSLKCHKVVLSASSIYFHKLFMESTCEHPIVFLQDVRVRDVRAILDYMYKGEVSVSQEDLPSLLKVAELLKVKGMMEEGLMASSHGRAAGADVKRDDTKDIGLTSAAAFSGDPHRHRRPSTPGTAKTSRPSSPVSGGPPSLPARPPSHHHHHQPHHNNNNNSINSPNLGRSSSLGHDPRRRRSSSCSPSSRAAASANSPRSATPPPPPPPVHISSTATTTGAASSSLSSLVSSLGGTPHLSAPGSPPTRPHSSSSTSAASSSTAMPHAFNGGGSSSVTSASSGLLTPPPGAANFRPPAAPFPPHHHPLGPPPPGAHLPPPPHHHPAGSSAASTAPFPMWPAAVGLSGLFPPGLFGATGGSPPAAPGSAGGSNHRDGDLKGSPMSPGLKDRLTQMKGEKESPSLANMPPLLVRDGMKEEQAYERHNGDLDAHGHLVGHGGAYAKYSPKYNGSNGKQLEGIAGYVPTQRLEWKRYKQYTRNDIMNAIEEVKKGKSALQVSKKFNIPSRTLYDKVKKMGITTGRQMQRKSMGSGNGSARDSSAGSASMPPSPYAGYSAAFPSFSPLRGLPDGLKLENPYKDLMERMKEAREEEDRDEREGEGGPASRGILRGGVSPPPSSIVAPPPPPFHILPPHMLNMMERIKSEAGPMNLSSSSAAEQRDREAEALGRMSSIRASEGSMPQTPSPGSGQDGPSLSGSSPPGGHHHHMPPFPRRSSGSPPPISTSVSAAAGHHHPLYSQASSPPLPSTAASSTTIDIRAQFLADLRRLGAAGGVPPPPHLGPHPGDAMPPAPPHHLPAVSAAAATLLAAHNDLMSRSMAAVTGEESRVGSRKRKAGVACSPTPPPQQPLHHHHGEEGKHEDADRMSAARSRGDDDDDDEAEEVERQPVARDSATGGPPLNGNDDGRHSGTSSGSGRGIKEEDDEEEMPYDDFEEDEEDLTAEREAAVNQAMAAVAAGLNATMAPGPAAAGGSAGQPGATDKAAAVN